jgi:NADH:ubiquinone oxidoreductase subunit 5 (subunit L)/multisubunit Na+/H+ antiporter MnhA subunit
VATDIKRVLAYSTISQLGYMMLGLGIAGWIAGLFHLITHAFFKSLMFLCSGSVIIGCHHEQEMTRRWGGCGKKMPITCFTMFIGVMAISRFGDSGDQHFRTCDRLFRLSLERCDRRDGDGLHAIEPRPLRCCS